MKKNKHPFNVLKSDSPVKSSGKTTVEFHPSGDVFINAKSITPFELIACLRNAATGLAASFTQGKEEPTEEQKEAILKSKLNSRYKLGSFQRPTIVEEPEQVEQPIEPTPEDLEALANQTAGEVKKPRKSRKKEAVVKPFFKELTEEDKRLIDEHDNDLKF